MEGVLLKKHERNLVTKHLEENASTVAQINEMFVATEKRFEENAERIEKLREKIVAEYTGVVFLDKLPPNPGPRGIFGEAYIPLKEDAQPTWQRPFGMTGEKEEA